MEMTFTWEKLVSYLNDFELTLQVET